MLATGSAPPFGGSFHPLPPKTTNSDSLRVPTRQNTGPSRHSQALSKAQTAQALRVPSSAGGGGRSAARNWQKPSGTGWSLMLGSHGRSTSDRRSLPESLTERGERSGNFCCGHPEAGPKQACLLILTLSASRLKYRLG